MVYGDGLLLRIASSPLNTIADVIEAFTAIDGALPDSDGIKWFNRVYLQVTQNVSSNAASRTWNNPAWLARLDVIFAGLYLSAMRNWLTPGQAAPKSWQVLFSRRYDARLARIQFALAGMNAHIDHDLAIAVVETCKEFGIAPVHLSPEYADYCHVNEVLDGVIDEAKHELLVGMAGETLPGLARLETTAAMWGLRGTREKAWTNCELLWHIQSMPDLAARFLSGLDDAGELVGLGLLAYSAGNNELR